MQRSTVKTLLLRIYSTTLILNGYPVVFLQLPVAVFEGAIRINNHVESWNGYILLKAGRKGKNIYLLSELLAKDAIVAMNDLDSYANKVYVRKTQAIKDAAIQAAYAHYKVHKNPWEALESLRFACVDHCNWGNVQTTESNNDETTESDNDENTDSDSD